MFEDSNAINDEYDWETRKWVAGEVIDVMIYES